jgi:sulfur carrier protein ThiS
MVTPEAPSTKLALALDAVTLNCASVAAKVKASVSLPLRLAAAKVNGDAVPDVTQICAERLLKAGLLTVVLAAP